MRTFALTFGLGLGFSSSALAGPGPCMESAFPDAHDRMDCITDNYVLEDTFDLAAEGNMIQWGSILNNSYEIDDIWGLMSQARLALRDLAERIDVLEAFHVVRTEIVVSYHGPSGHDVSIGSGVELVELQFEAMQSDHWMYTVHFQLPNGCELGVPNLENLRLVDSIGVQHGLTEQVICSGDYDASVTFLTVDPYSALSTTLVAEGGLLQLSLHADIALTAPVGTETQAILVTRALVVRDGLYGDDITPEEILPGSDIVGYTFTVIP